MHWLLAGEKQMYEKDVPFRRVTLCKCIGTQSGQKTKGFDYPRVLFIKYKLRMNSSYSNDIYGSAENASCILQHLIMGKLTRELS